MNGENAYVYLAACERQMRRSGIDKAVRERVLTDARSKDYEHLQFVCANWRERVRDDLYTKPL